MATNYINLIGTYYPDSSATIQSGGVATNYNDIIWLSTPIPQEDLDIICLVEIKTNKIIEFSVIANEEIIDGFVDATTAMYDKLEECLPEYEELLKQQKEKKKTK